MNRPPFYRINEPHAVYRVWDADGQLLYVGCSVSPLNRIAQHSKQKAWRTTIARVDVEWHANFECAQEAEATAIANEHPFWNVHHKTSQRVQAVGRFHEAYDEGDPSTWVRKVSS